ncbi:MAG: DNA-directed RNA polymerase subunit M [Desulfurococcales archaeon]|nr:DNA-directed RNA polymerase subunit M [Desulfurococcales archaeon]
MRFCPKCGTMMVPVRKGKKTVLKCPKCGYEEVLNTNNRDYKIEIKETAQKVRTTSVVSEGEEKKRTKEELEQEKEEFYEVFLDLMSEEEGP